MKQINKKPKIKTMWRIQGLENSPKNDKNLYPSLKVAEMFAPTPSVIWKTTIIQL